MYVSVDGVMVHELYPFEIVKLFLSIHIRWINLGQLAI